MAKPHISGSADIEVTTQKESCCAKVKSAAKIDVGVRTVLPTDAVGVVYTDNGLKEVGKHEERRRTVYELAYYAYIDPVESTGYRATRCGTICRQQAGEAERLLTDYLDRLQQYAISEFNNWVQLQQQAITGESYDWEMSGNLRDHIKNPVTVGKPPALGDPIPCPDFQ